MPAVPAGGLEGGAHAAPALHAVAGKWRPPAIRIPPSGSGFTQEEFAKQSKELTAVFISQDSMNRQLREKEQHILRIERMLKQQAAQTTNHAEKVSDKQGGDAQIVSERTAGRVGTSLDPELEQYNEVLDAAPGPSKVLATVGQTCLDSSPNETNEATREAPNSESDRRISNLEVSRQERL